MARSLHPILVLLGALLSFGCEEDVTSALGTSRAYTLYGVLSPQLDTQWVRVYPIEERLEPETDAVLDARFTSVDRTTGEELTWEDSLIVDAFDQMAHVFWAPFRAEHGHTYGIAVTRSDGRRSTAEVGIPRETTLEIRPPEVTIRSVFAPVLVEGDAPRLLRIEAVYAVEYVPIRGTGLESAVVSIYYDGLQEDVAEGWIVPINLRADALAVTDSIQLRIERPIDRSVGLFLDRVTLRLIVANQDWDPPGGSFDPEVLVQPGTLSNVENGFGYVVAGYRQEIGFLPSPEVAEAAGFRSR